MMDSGSVWLVRKDTNASSLATLIGRREGGPSCLATALHDQCREQTAGGDNGRQYHVLVALIHCYMVYLEMVL